MDITFDGDTLIYCSDCGQPARQREVDVSHDKHSRRVPFQTHAMSLHYAEQGEVFQRVAAFYERTFALIDEMQAIPIDGRKLSIGRLVSFDIEPVMPSACARRTEIVAVTTVRVAGLTREVKLAPRPLAGATVEAILVDLKEAASPIAAQLNAQIEAKDF